MQGTAAHSATQRTAPLEPPQPPDNICVPPPAACLPGPRRALCALAQRLGRAVVANTLVAVDWGWPGVAVVCRRDGGIFRSSGGDAERGCGGGGFRKGTLSGRRVRFSVGCRPFPHENYFAQCESRPAPCASAPVAAARSCRAGVGRPSVRHVRSSCSRSGVRSRRRRDCSWAWLQRKNARGFGRFLGVVSRVSWPRTKMEV